MSQFRDLIARMAIDAEFARHARAHPDLVARQYRLTTEETDQLIGLADASADGGPTALGVRLSKSGTIFGSLSLDGFGDWSDLALQGDSQISDTNIAAGALFIGAAGAIANKTTSDKLEG